MTESDWTYASQYGFTVEPGIYIPEGFGIRLEDDLVIQESGEPFKMRNIPIKAMKLKVWWTNSKGVKD
jgi:Xaa-Pro aminopeptidase